MFFLWTHPCTTPVFSGHHLLVHFEKKSQQVQSTEPVNSMMTKAAEMRTPPNWRPPPPAPNGLVQLLEKRRRGFLDVVLGRDVKVGIV